MNYDEDFMIENADAEPLPKPVQIALQIFAVLQMAAIVICLVLSSLGVIG